MLLKKIILTILIVFFICTSFLWAGDNAVFVDLGFSPDGRTYMFGQYGVLSPSLKPWAELYVIDMITNNFVQAEPSAREVAIKHVKDWIDVASKLGGQTLRIFTGNDVPAGHSREQAFQWVVDCTKECAAYGRKRGVILAIQNHYDFAKTADQVEALLKAIDSEWVGLMLDIGSYRSADPYAEIKQTIKYAISWQIKEEMYINGKAVKTDLDKIKEIIANSTYRGYLPIETLGEGDPKQKVALMFHEVKKRFS